MLNSGDVVQLGLGLPPGRETGFRHPAIVVTAQRILSSGPNVVHVVPLTSRLRQCGNVGIQSLTQVCEVISVLLDLPR